MKMIDEAGILAIATRLHRLSDNLRRDGSLIYKAYGIDFEPKYFPVVFVLHAKPLLSIVQVAEEIGYSHPSTITLLKDLEKKGLIVSKKDANDDRKRMVQLTPKGRTLVKKIQPIWQVMTSALDEILATRHNLLSAITEVEARIEEQGFYQRALRKSSTSIAITSA